jgi:transposase
MAEDIQKSCGLDIHKDFVIATFLTRGKEGKIQKRFERDDDGILALRDFVLEQESEVVACESTNDFWMPIYDCLNENVTVIVGNARDIKALNHKKTDKIDSEHIALLALNGMINSSRVFPKYLRDIRSLTRHRHKIVSVRTIIKNTIHSILSSELFHLKKALTDIFGTTGKIILEGLVKGYSIEKIIRKFPQCMKNREDEFRELLKKEISQDAILRLKLSLDIMEVLDKSIKEIEKRIFNWAYNYRKREMETLMSVPGIGEISAVTLITEIGDFNDFPTPGKLASWLGIVPNVYQSANKYCSSSITKRGSKNARWILIQVAQVAAARTGKNKLSEFFKRKKPVIGYNKAIVALAHKIVRTIWSLIVNENYYEDEYNYAKKISKPSYSISLEEISIDECLSIFVQAKSVLSKKGPEQI